MHIKKVYGNVKAGCDLEIGEKTLIVGPNGSGKSSVVNTIELALTGRAGDIAGRVDVAREVDVMSLATGGANTLTASVMFDDEATVAGYQTEGSTAKAKKATQNVPDELGHADVLPIRSLREALLGSPATARKYLLGKMSEGVTVERVQAMLDVEVYGEFDRLMKAYKDAPMSDALIGALETAGSQAREAQGKAKSAKMAATFVTGGAAIPPSNEEVAAAKKAASDLQRQYADAVARNAQVFDLGAYRSEVEVAEANAMQAISALRASEADLEAMPSPTEFDENRGLLIATAKLSVNEGSCAVCGNTEIADLPEVLKALDAEFNAHVEQAKAYEKRKAEVNRLRQEAEWAIRSFEKAEARLKDAEEAQATAKETPILDPEEIKAQYDIANNRVIDLQNKRSAWDTAHKAQKEAADAERQAESWATLKSALAVVVEKLVDGALASFTAKVQANLPPTDTFAMILRDGEREVVKFGLVRDGVLHTALSGAEWARVMAAMADACVPEGKYACIVPEERAFDAKTLGDVMKALNNSRHQVILTSPIAPKSPPKNWTIVKRGAE